MYSSIGGRGRQGLKLIEPRRTTTAVTAILHSAYEERAQQDNVRDDASLSVLPTAWMYPPSCEEKAQDREWHMELFTKLYPLD